MENSFLKNNTLKLISFALFLFFLYTLFLKFAGYFQIGLMSDDYLNFISAQNSTLKQKFASSIPLYSNLHFRPFWFLSINFSIWLNNFFGAGNDNFVLFRIENLLYFYILIFLTSYLFFKVSGRLLLTVSFLILCLVYPNNINDICWTIGRVDLMCGIFLISSLLITFSFVEKKSLIKLFLVLLFFSFGLFTKETSVMIPFITIALVYISFNKEKAVEIKNLIALEIFILLIYTLVRIYIIGIYPSEVVSTFQTPGVFSSISVIFKALIALIIPYDYLSLQNNFSAQNKLFFFYLVLIIVLLVTTIFIFVRTNNIKFIFYLSAVFLISIFPNLIAGYFRPQLILIPFLIFYLTLFILISRISFNLKFYKTILPLLFIIYLLISYNLIGEWNYSYQYSQRILSKIIEINPDKDKKNIILGLPARYGQTHLLEYATGPYNYRMYGEFNLHDKIYDLSHTGSLDTNSLSSELSVKKLSGNEFEIESTGKTQYFLKLDGNPAKYKDEDIIIKLSGKNSFRKFTEMYVRILSDKANVYLLNGDNFIKLN